MVLLFDAVPPTSTPTPVSVGVNINPSVLYSNTLELILWIMFLDISKIKYISCDKLVDNGACFKYRPDFLIDCGSHFVVLEVDENQHKGRAYGCEEVRMVNIFQSLGLSTKFIRYNPDKYKKNGKWLNPSVVSRMRKLSEHLGYAIHDAPISFLSVKHVFFDDKEETVFEQFDLTKYNL